MSMVVITPDGELVHHPEPVTSPAIRAVMPGIGFDVVRLRGHTDLCGMVDADGHPRGLPRNPVGSCVLSTLGAGSYPYCGPVAITGWSEPDDASELRDLTELQLAWVAAVCAGIKDTLAGQPPRWMTVDGARLRDYAQWVNEAPSPSLRFSEIPIERVTWTSSKQR